ncbi:HIT family protein [Paenibacillus sp. FSL K6-1096]|uniref:HIT family protein n=1 Tax=Paenibacillus sp. FSL K6-1096 TaxID=2921460 RepID=UPI0030ED056E
MTTTCFICDKHRGNTPQPPGGYIYEDEHWKLCHFPADQSVPGQLVLESQRHLLDFAEMTEEEAGSYGVLVQKIVSALKQATGAERVYTVIMVDGVPHFHAHFLPRRSDSAKGIAFIAQQNSCTEEEAAELAGRLRFLLN